MDFMLITSASTELERERKNNLKIEIHRLIYEVRKFL